MSGFGWAAQTLLFGYLALYFGLMLSPRRQRDDQMADILPQPLHGMQPSHLSRIVCAAAALYSAGGLGFSCVDMRGLLGHRDAALKSRADIRDRTKFTSPASGQGSSALKEYMPHGPAPLRCASE